MNQHPDPNEGQPWQQAGGETPGWGMPPDQHTGGPPSGGHGSHTGGYQAADIGGQPVPNEPTIDTIGDIAITQNTVITPGGRFPIKGTVWTMSDMSRTEQSIPAWAIIVAILFIWFCLLSLLFLLVKETKTTGHIQVTVQGGGHYHAAQIPVSHRSYVHHVNQQVNHARSLAA